MSQFPALMSLLESGRTRSTTKGGSKPSGSSGPVAPKDAAMADTSDEEGLWDRIRDERVAWSDQAAAGSMVFVYLQAHGRSVGATAHWYH